LTIILPTTFHGCRTGCRSAAASAPQKVCQKANDLARAAVGWNGVFGAPASVVRVPTACADHTCTRSRLHNQPRSESRPAHDHACTTGFSLNHAQHTTRLPITSAQHNGLPYHARHNGQSAQRAVVPHAAPRAPARRKRHNERSRSAIRLVKIKNRMPLTLPGRRTGWASAAAHR
jgi:hypothetical protein